MSDSSDKARIRELAEGLPASGEIETIVERLASRDKRSADIVNTVFSNLEYAIFLIDAETRTIMRASDALMPVFGYEPQDVIGRGTEFLHVDCEHWEQFDRISKPVVEERKTYNTEYPMRRRDGRIFVAEITVSAIDVPGSELNAVLSIVRDISERKRREEETNSIVQQLGVVFNQIPALLWTTNERSELTSLRGFDDDPVVLAPLGDAARRPADLFEHVVSESGDPTKLEDVTAAGLFRRNVSCTGKRNGKTYAIRVSPFRDPDDRVTGSIGIAHDISDRREYEKVLEQSLRERESLIREIHHRVKNNLQLINSMLSLQISRSGASETGGLQATAGRIYALSIVYEQLITADRMASVDMANYLKDLTGMLATNSGDVLLELDIAPVIMDVDRAVAVALIVNELVTNSMQHGFSEGGAGTVRVTLRYADSEALELCVCDDGAGFSDPAAASVPTTLGLQLVSTLADQISATVSWGHNSGATTTLRFPAEAAPVSRRFRT